MAEIVIRREEADDIEGIRAVTELAFRGMPYAAGDEQDVIDRLRAAAALSFSLVALQGDHIIGHAAFSPATVNPIGKRWFALGPISVQPEMQGKGIGSELIRTGLELLELDGAQGCILTGNPDYYARFGFVLSPKHCPENEPKEYFMIKQFERSPVLCKFAFHEAFYGNT